MNNFSTQTRRGTATILAILAIIIVLSAAQSARADVKPFVSCVERERDGSGTATGNYIAYFGYSSDRAANSILPYNGANNFFDPVEPQNGISVFQPGVHPQVISVTAPLSTDVSWFLGITLVTASFNNSNLCAADGANSRLMTYQGKLSDGSTAANGIYDLQFQLYNQLTSGAAQTSLIALDNVQVTNGIFTVQLDLGAAALSAEGTAISRIKLNPSILDAENSFFEIGVRPGTSTGAYTVLTPRQSLTAVPLAMRANTANNAFRATNADNFNGLPPEYYLRNSSPYQSSTSFNVGNGIVTGDLTVNGTINGTASNAAQLGGVAASSFVQTNSTSFVRNQTTQQASTNFNVSGTGAANIFNATTQFNIGGSRILSNAGDNNLFAGVDSGRANTTGYQNSFVGAGAGYSNKTGINNSFVGAGAGYFNTTGASNSFFGALAGFSNTEGYDNSFVGKDAGRLNTTGSNNTALGNGADFGAGNLTNATAIGAGATVSTSNTVMLGRTADTVQIPGTLNVSGTVSSGCRTGFSAVSNGRLCISAMQPAATYINAAQACTNMGARLGNSADVALSFTLSGFNYFAGSPGGEPVPKGWLADIINDNVRATWNAVSPNQDFDGTPLNVNTGGTGGTAPQLLYRCVY